MENKFKSRFKSKTYGFGVILAALGLAALGLPEFKALLETMPAEYQGVALFIIGVLTLVLRELTKVPVGSPPS